MSVRTVRPAAVSGPLTAKNARVIYDDTQVVVVTQKETKHYTRTDAPAAVALSGRTTLGTTEGTLTVIQQGGCTCGKPWLTKPPAAELLTSV